MITFSGVLGFKDSPFRGFKVEMQRVFPVYGKLLMESSMFKVPYHRKISWKMCSQISFQRYIVLFLWWKMLSETIFVRIVKIDKQNFKFLMKTNKILKLIRNWKWGSPRVPKSIGNPNKASFLKQTTFGTFGWFFSRRNGKITT